MVANGDALLSPSITRRVVQEFARRTPDPVASPGLQRLTNRETDVLRSLSQGRSNAEIAAALFVSEATVKTYVSAVLAETRTPRPGPSGPGSAYENGLFYPTADTGPEPPNPDASKRRP